MKSGEFSAGFSASNLDQETAGFIIGQDTYKDPATRTTNPNPEAFRKADSQRLFLRWIPNDDNALSGSDFRAYLRRSDMEFLQHFIPGQPLEENGQVSGGLMWVMQKSVGSSAMFTSGLDLEYANGFVKQFQAEPLNGGSAFLNATLPQGWQYDFDVSSFMLAPYGQIEFPLDDSWQLVAGLRLEYLYYDYDNQMVVGNTRDDGITTCGFGGCRYNRPADRSDDFLNLAPNIGVLYHINPTTSAYLNISRGFRAPQMTELYRLQNGQQVADLDSEQLDSLELGLRVIRQAWSTETTAFVMLKRNSVFRDANGFNVSGARSRHAGVETAFAWQAYKQWRLELSASYARHRYDFDRVAAQGETFVSGRDIDTAPRWLASAEIFFNAPGPLDLSLQWTTIGPYYLDAENRFRYPGHELYNLRAGLDVSRGLSLAMRLNNLTDADVADRADFAFGQYRYFPGRGREFFVEVRYRAPQGN